MTTPTQADVLSPDGELANLLRHWRVERFLLREARLMDDHKYEEWFALWAPDLLYWVPCNSEDLDPVRQVSIIYEKRVDLELRVWRLSGRYAHAQTPRSRLQRLISNIEIQPTTDALVVTSTFVLGEARMRDDTILFGRAEHTLVPHGDSFLMSRKKVVLLNNDKELPNIVYLL
jgi:3-phenylpropionate/cinnamic acid dioxygenase small subunit